MIETIGPKTLIAIEPIVGLLHRLGAQGAGDDAAALLAGDEAGVGQDVEMFHHRRQRHGERLGELAHRDAFAFAELREQRAPRGVGKGREGAVEGGGRIVNHMVKCIRAQRGVKSVAGYLQFN